MGYQPPLSHPVFYNGTAINTENWQTGTNGVAITRIEGWYDAPDVRDVRELNAGRDGELADNLYLGGRTIVIQGIVSGSSYADLQAKKLALGAKLIPSSTEYVLKLPDADNASPSWTHSSSMADFERVEARVVEGVQFGENDGPLLQSWSVTLRASDPLVYSDTLTTVDSGTSGTAARTAAVTNSGTYASPGSIVVTGPTASSWTISDSDNNTYLDFSNLALASTSDSTTIDLQQRTIQTTGTFETARLLLNDINSLWMVDETSGTTADNAEGTASRDGTYTGGFTLNQSGPFSGLSSVDLNGTTGYVAIPYASGTLWGSAGDAQVWEFWFNTDALSGTQTVFDSVSSNRGFRVQIDSIGQVQLAYGNGSGTSTTGHGFVTASSWNQFVVHFNANGSRKVQTYLNGIGRSVFFSAMALPTATGGRLGSTLAGGNYFNGKIGPTTQLLFSGANEAVSELAAINATDGNAATFNTFNKLAFESAQWSSIDTGSSTYTLNSTGLNTGSKLSVQYRSARI